LPSEFGTDPAKMENAMEPGRITFDDKMKVRKAIEEAGIPFTYVSANCFAGYFLGGLCQPGRILPSKDNVVLLGDGNPRGTLFIPSLSLLATYPCIHSIKIISATNFEIITSNLKTMINHLSRLIEIKHYICQLKIFFDSIEKYLVTLTIRKETSLAH
jgi:hypothetical protein